MKTLVTLSRSFVEFGPFTKAEILDFSKRGLLQDTDYLRDEGASDWLHYAEWLTTAEPVKKLELVKAPKAVKAAKAPAAKAPAAKKAKKVA